MKNQLVLDIEIEKENDYQVEKFWEKKQRELVTSTVDYNLESLSNLNINLSPEYQRRERWDDIRQSKLIESFLMNVPVPPVFLNEDSYGQYSVIDGKQRITAVKRFIHNELKLKGLTIFSELNGKSFKEIPNTLQDIIRTRPTLRATIILRQSDQDVKFEVFQRLNTGGVKLNSQEIRNSTSVGLFNDLIINLSVLQGFHSLLGIKDKAKSQIYQEMRDVELVLRFFALRNNWQTYSGNMRNTLDRYMHDNQKVGDGKAGKKRLEVLNKEFIDAIEKVEAAFGEHSFRRWSVKDSKWKKPILSALFDAQMIACMGKNKDVLQKNQAKIIAGMKLLFNDEQFEAAISSSTNTPSFIIYRIQKVSELIESIK